MENDLDFRKDDLVYCKNSNYNGVVFGVNHEYKYIRVQLENIQNYVDYNYDGTYRHSSDFRSSEKGRTLFHDADRTLKESIDKILNSSKPPKRVVKRYFNLFTNNTYNSYLSKDDAEKCHRYKGIPSVEYYAVAVEAEVLEDE